MKPYQVHIPEDLKEKMERDMQSSGIDNFSGFMRMLARQYPFRDGKQWADVDMLNFAIHIMKAMGVPKPNEIQLKQAFENFKNNRL